MVQTDNYQGSYRTNAVSVFVDQPSYMKSKMSCSKTRRKFRVKFPERPVPNPSTIMRQAERFKEMGPVKNRKVNRRRHVLTEETLDEFGEKNWTEITEWVFADPQGCRPIQGRERQPSVATRSIWEALYIPRCKVCKKSFMIIIRIIFFTDSVVNTKSFTRINVYLVILFNNSFSHKSSHFYYVLFVIILNYFRLT